jgi:hypothetical protein
MPWHNRRIRRKISPASPCPDFAARHFVQNPFASCLPQDSPRELMFDPCAKHNSGTSASLHSSLAALRERRIGHARCRTSDNCLMRGLNPSRTDRRSIAVALKPFALLDFSTAPKRQKPAKRRRSPQFGRNAPEFAARLDVARRTGGALTVTHGKPLNSHPVSAPPNRRGG